jgi:hypothetical protein
MSELDLDAEEFAPVHVVQLQLCDPCIDGEGDECHTPGCSLWLNRPPDIGLRDNPSVTIAAAAEPQPAPELAAAMAEGTKLRKRLDAIRKLCETRIRTVGMVDGKGVARKVIAIIDKPEDQ